MTDLEKRAQAFREKHQLHKRKATAGFSPTINAFELIAEIRFVRENPPQHHPHAPSLQANVEVGWQSFADHLLDCLGEK